MFFKLGHSYNFRERTREIPLSPLLTPLIWVKVFKNGSSKICGRQPFKKIYLIYFWIPWPISYMTSFRVSGQSPEGCSEKWLLWRISQNFQESTRTWVFLVNWSSGILQVYFKNFVFLCQFFWHFLELLIYETPENWTSLNIIGIF